MTRIALVVFSLAGQLGDAGASTCAASLEAAGCLPTKDVEECLSCAFRGWAPSYGAVGVGCNKTEVPHSDVELACGASPTPTPLGLACDAATAGASVALSWSSEGVADVFEVSLATPHRPKPYATYLTSGGSTSASLGGLEANATVVARVRAHAANASAAMVGWSEYSAPVSCVAAVEEPEEPEETSRAGATSLRVYRWSEGTSTVDYLDDHDVGDALGEAAYFTVALNYDNATLDPTSWWATEWPNSTVVEYCVDVAPPPPGKDEWAQYASCNTYSHDGMWPSEVGPPPRVPRVSCL